MNCVSCKTKYSYTVLVLLLKKGCIKLLIYEGRPKSRQSACLVFNPIMVDNYAAFFNCTPVGRASDSMMAPT